MNLFVPMFGVGLLTGFHCVTMCGGMVFSYSVRGGRRQESWLERIAPQFGYQTAKILSYVTVGLVLGAVGAAFNIAGIRSWATIVAGVFMILVGLQLSGFFPALNKFRVRPPKFLVRAITKLRRRVSKEAEAQTEAFVTPILFGLLTGLMPCGPLIAAEIAAAGSGSAVDGALAMLGFGLGTIPVMLAFGATASLLSARFQKWMTVAAAVIVIVLGAVFINRGAVLLGSPVTFNTVAEAIVGRPLPEVSGIVTQDSSGVAEVKIAIKETQFIPSTVQIPADRPVRLIVDRQESAACSNQIAVPQLGVLQDLAPNATTVVELPATKGGTYNLTCGMGMMSGTLVAVPAGGRP
jgi:sulfite exporter TauE/SafE